MKSKKNLLEQLKALPHFEKSDICQLAKQLELKDSTVDTYISRFLKYRDIIPLKKGMYVSTDFFEKHKRDISYTYYLANIIRTPSYVSSWTALQYYNLATESIYAITSVTSKVTRDYRTKVGNFSYQSMKKELFSDFYLAKGTFEFFIASPAKALFDVLYFKTNQFRSISMKNIHAIIEDLRIDIDEMDRSEQEKFYSMIKKYE